MVQKNIFKITRFFIRSTTNTYSAVRTYSAAWLLMSFDFTGVDKEDAEKDAEDNNEDDDSVGPLAKRSRQSSSPAAPTASLIPPGPLLPPPLGSTSTLIPDTFPFPSGPMPPYKLLSPSSPPLASPSADKDRILNLVSELNQQKQQRQRQQRQQRQQQQQQQLLEEQFKRGASEETETEEEGENGGKLNSNALASVQAALTALQAGQMSLNQV